MSNSMPCFTDSDANRLPEEGHETPLPKYRNNTHRAAIEDCHAISITGLTIMWGNWASIRPSMLPNLLHGAQMVLNMPYLSNEYRELSFLHDVAAQMAADEVDYK